MTIAIGIPFRYKELDCSLVCADSKVVATDGATMSGSKVSMGLSASGGSFAIAGATEDADAALMLATDIKSALCDHGDNPYGVEAVIQEVMTRWHGAYGSCKPPSIQYVLGVGIQEHCNLFLCSPPNTVLRKNKAFAIGSGARALDPFLSDEPGPISSVNAAIARAAYWMYRAKQYEGSFCGGKSHAFIISEHGGFGFVKETEFDKIEALGKRIDAVMNKCLQEMMSDKPDIVQQTFLSDFGAWYLSLSEEIAAAKFLDGVRYVNPPKQLTAQKSEPER